MNACTVLEGKMDPLSSTYILFANQTGEKYFIHHHLAPPSTKRTPEKVNAFIADISHQYYKHQCVRE